MCFLYFVIYLLTISTALGQEVFVTTTKSSGAGSLQDILASAESEDIIYFAPALAGQTIFLGGNLPYISVDLNIVGPQGSPVTIDGGKSYSIFNILSGSVLISHLNLLNPGSIATGAAIFVNSDAKASLSNVGIASCEGEPNCQNPIHVTSSGMLAMQSSALLKNGIGTNTASSTDIMLDVDSAFIVDSASDMELSIEGSGNVYKRNSGTLKLVPNAPSIDITLIIEEGTLDFTGTTLEPILIFSGGKLIGNNSSLYIVNAGTLKPGNSIGMVTVLGDYFQTSTGTLQIELAPSGLSDIVQVGNNAMVAGGLTLLPEKGIYFKGTVFTFLTAGIGVTGVFDKVSSIAGGLSYRINYLPTSIEVEILQNLLNYQGIKIGGSARRVLSLLENADAPVGSDLATVLTALNALDFSNSLKAGLNQLHSAPYVTLGWADATTMHHVAVELVQQRVSFCERGCKKDLSSECCPQNRSNGIWTSVIGEKTHQGDFDALPGFHGITRGALVGYDRAITKQVTLGAAAGYTYEDLFWHREGGKTKIKGYHASIYTAFCLGRLLVDASLLSSFYDHDVSRQIHFMERSAHSAMDGWGVMEHVGARLIFDTDRVKITPFILGEHTHLSRDKVKEHGADSINLRFGRSQMNFVRGEVGINVKREFCTSWGTVVPSLSLSYVCFASTSDTSLRTHFAGVPQGFTIQVTDHAFSAIAPTGSLGWIPYQDMWISLSYAGEFAKKRQDQQMGLNFRWQF